MFFCIFIYKIVLSITFKIIITFESNKKGLLEKPEDTKRPGLRIYHDPKRVDFYAYRPSLFSTIAENKATGTD